MGTYNERLAGRTPRSLSVADASDIAADAVTGNRSESKARGKGNMAKKAVGSKSVHATELAGRDETQEYQCVTRNLSGSI